MLRIFEKPLSASALTALNTVQQRINAEPDYPAQVIAAQKAWKTKTSTRTNAAAFQQVRQTLSSMCVGARRCAYCEDSLADEVEHIRPKTFFPDLAFVWENYLFACGPFNGPKGSRYGVLNQDIVQEFRRLP